MKKRALSLALCMVLALGLLSAAPSALAVDLDRPCSLTVALGIRGFAEDLENQEGSGAEAEDVSGVALDLYLLADAEAVPGYDAFSFVFREGYDSLSVDGEMDSAAWRALAQEAARLALAPGGAPREPDLAGQSLDTEISGLTAGLYLVIARGAEMPAEKYVSEIEGEDGETRLVTLAESESYVYTFQPELAVLPWKDAQTGEEGSVTAPNTANAGAWITDVKMELKPEREDRYGKLRIVKGLDLYENSEPATFVFSVVGVRDGETVYSNVTALTFSQAGLMEAELDRIPVGAQVTVTEVYSGASYTVVGDLSQTAVITAEEAAQVRFDNTYDGQKRRGHGILNQFRYNEGEDGDGGWEWTQDPAPAA